MPVIPAPITAMCATKGLPLSEMDRIGAKADQWSPSVAVPESLTCDLYGADVPFGGRRATSLSRCPAKRSWCLRVSGAVAPSALTSPGKARQRRCQSLPPGLVGQALDRIDSGEFQGECCSARNQAEEAFCLRLEAHIHEFNLPLSRWCLTAASRHWSRSNPCEACRQCEYLDACAAMAGRAQIRQSERLLRRPQAHPRPYLGPDRATLAVEVGPVAAGR